MSLPSQTQLMLPLLEILNEHGGAARPKQIYDELAYRIGLSDELRNRKIVCGRQEVNEFERRCRWTRQTAVLKGLIDKGERSFWRITETAKAKLSNIQRGTILTFAIGESGAFIWANAEDAVAVIEPGSVQLLCTSAPYPLRQPREYGNLQAPEWLDWMLRLVEQWCGLLTSDGSIMLNVGPVFKEGMPAQNIYTERLLVSLEDKLGIHLVQRLDWHSPTRMPPLRWCGIERSRVTPSVEPILWLSPNPNAYGNNLAVLRPYSKRGLESIAKPSLHKRPSGTKFGVNSFKDRGGSIPPSLISETPTGKDDALYRRAMRAVGREPHPATMPAAVARFCIMLASRVDDVVYDPFAGSGTTVVEAIKAGRRGLGSERSRTYLEGALIRAHTASLELEQVA